MYYFDLFTDKCREKYTKIEKDIISKISPEKEINTPYGYASYKKKLKEFFFKVEEKKTLEKTVEKEVKKEAEGWLNAFFFMNYIS